MSCWSGSVVSPLLGNELDEHGEELLPFDAVQALIVFAAGIVEVDPQYATFAAVVLGIGEDYGVSTALFDPICGSRRDRLWWWRSTAGSPYLFLLSPFGMTALSRGSALAPAKAVAVSGRG